MRICVWGALGRDRGMAKKTLDGGVELSPGAGKASLPLTSVGTCFSLSRPQRPMGSSVFSTKAIPK